MRLHLYIAIVLLVVNLVTQLLMVGLDMLGGSAANAGAVGAEPARANEGSPARQVSTRGGC